MPRARVAASNDLNRMPMNGGANPAPTAAATRLAARTASASSTCVAAVAVAVLEVDAQVLDRLALRASRARAARRLGGEPASRPTSDGERLESARVVGGGERGARPTRSAARA